MLGGEGTRPPVDGRKSPCRRGDCLGFGSHLPGKRTGRRRMPEVCITLNSAASMLDNSA
jgi:hypothetical protein